MPNSYTKIIETFLNEYKRKGFITEDELFSNYIKYKIPLLKVDSITEHLLALGVLIINKEELGKGDTPFTDRSKLDYDKIYDEVKSIQPELESFIDNARKIRPPQLREWQSLIPQAQNGNLFARNRLVEMYLRIVIRQAVYYSKKYKTMLDENIQNGVLGLIYSIKKYDARKHDKFAVYAQWWISQYIQREMTIYNNLLSFPVWVKDRIFSVQKLISNHHSYCSCQNIFYCDFIANNYKRKFQDDKIAIEQVRTFLHQFISLNEIDPQSGIINDDREHEDEMLEAATIAQNNIKLIKIINRLDVKEKQVLLYRLGFCEGKSWTLEQVGNEFGVTRERIRQIEKKALNKINAFPEYQRLICDS